MNIIICMNILCLVHWGREIMAAMFVDDKFICTFLKENLLILDTIPLKYLPSGLFAKNIIGWDDGLFGHRLCKCDIV